MSGLGRLGLGLRNFGRRGSSIGGSPAVNTVAPSISGTRGGTLTATPGTWTGATSVSGQWYADGVATGNTTTSFTDSDTSKSLEYRETALPGSVVASGYLGALATPTYSENFDSYADGTLLAARYNTAVGVFSATPTPHVDGWDSIAYQKGGANYQSLKIVGGKITEDLTVSPDANGAVVHDFGAVGGTWDIELAWSAASGIEQRRAFAFSAYATSVGTSVLGLILVCMRTDVNFSFTLTPSGGTPAAITVNLPSTWVNGDVLRVRIDPATKFVFFYRNGVVVGNSSGYDLSTWAGTWTNMAGLKSAYNATLPTNGEALVNSLSYTSPTANSIASAAINQQPTGQPWQKQLDFTASIGDPSATGAQFKIETEAGQFVQGWTSATFASGTASGTYLIPDHAFEGQKLKVLVKNVGGTVKTTSGLTATNSYVMQSAMLVGVNDLDWVYWSFHTPGRDWAERRPNTSSIGIVDKNFATSFRQTFKAPGLTRDNYNHWAEAYNPAQLYPSTTGTTVYGFCTYQGLSWQTTDTTAKTRAAPDTSNLSGVGGDWKLASGSLADASLVNLTADGLPTKLPDDPNLTIFFTPPWYPTASHGAAGFTVTYKTQPGIALKHVGSLGNTTFSQSPADIAAGQFTLTYKPTTFGNYNPQLWIDRANSTATLDSTFFLAGIPSFATGTPSADIGSPYMDADKQADIAPFAGVRFMGALPIQRFAGSWNGTFTAANNVMPDGTLRIWKLIADQANLSGAQYVWLNEPDGADTSFRTAMATFFRDHLNAGIKIALERSNEQWNGNYQNAQDLITRANALVSTDGAYQKPYLLHCREHNAMVAVWKSVFGAAYASRVEPQLAWQSGTSTSTWQQMLDFENTWQNVGRISIAPYVDGGIGTYKSTATGDQASMNAAISAGDQTAFNTALTSYLAAQTDNEVALCKALFNFLPGYSMSKGLDKNAIQVSYYEAGFFQVSYSSFAALGAGKDTVANTFFTAYKRANTGLGARFAYYIDQIRLNAPGLMMTFQLLGPTGLQFGASTDTWGMMDGTGQTTQEPMATVKAKAFAYN